MYKTVILLFVFCLGFVEKCLKTLLVHLAVLEWELPERLKTLKMRNIISNTTGQIWTGQ